MQRQEHLLRDIRNQQEWDRLQRQTWEGVVTAGNSRMLAEC
jgi:hypothetical protein